MKTVFEKEREVFLQPVVFETSNSSESRRKTEQPFTCSRDGMIQGDARCRHRGDDGTVIIARGTRKEKGEGHMDDQQQSPSDAHPVVFAAKQPFRACAFDEAIGNRGRKETSRKSHGNLPREETRERADSELGDVDGCQLRSLLHFIEKHTTARNRCDFFFRSCSWRS
ncbi:hypothetical protein X777_05394 [Ooceraea biroi]|uniref:Uncharacterized protein n=1 Tax=Ooceraea biroi TaxID=2015173 RepID=A0A026WGS1_OOCBI|nr:hypothetical protein X777_05394 [Ooceraea biroi]